MNIRTLVSFLLVISFAACSGTTKKTEPAKPEEPTKPKFELDQREPRFQPVLGQAELTVSDPIAIEAVEVSKTKTHFLAKFNVQLVGNDQRATVASDAHTVAVYAPRDRAVYTRTVGTTAPKNLSIVFRTQGNFGRSGRETVATATFPTSAKNSKTLTEKLFFESMSYSLRFNSTTPYHSYMAGRFSNWDKEKFTRQPNRPARMNGGGEIFGLYSGVASIRESLQHDRGLWIRRPDEKATIDINTIEPIKIKEHPWAKMIAAENLSPKPDPIAKYIPGDVAYAYFPDLRTFVTMIGDLDEWASPVAQQVEGRIGARHFVSYYEKQLMLQRSGIAETIGHVAAHDVAITIGDPFVRGGTDVGFIFRVNDETALLTALKAFEVAATATRDDVSTATYKIGPHQVRMVESKDRTISQHRVRIGELLILSNSKPGLVHLLNGAIQKVPVLADRGDYQYMRGHFSSDDETEDGFAFVSDAFVERAISPATRIAHSRRFERESELLSINYATLLHGLLEGTNADIESLQKKGYLSKDALQHPDKTPITFNPEHGASSKFGSARMMRSLSEFQIEKVTKAEKEAYDQFKQTYQSYWQTFVDPIAIRIKHEKKNSAFDIDVKILPLIDNSEYNELIRLVGDTTIETTQIDDGLEWTFGIGENAGIRNFLDGGMKSMVSSRLSIGWLGDWIKVGVLDHAAVWDFAVLADMVPSLPRERTGAIFGTDEMELISDTPIYTMVDIKNTVAFGALISTLKNELESAMPDAVIWGPLPDKHNEISIVEVRENKSDKESFSIYYALINDTLVLSPKLNLVKFLIDRVQNPSNSEFKSQSVVSAQFAEKGYLARTLAGAFERESEHDDRRAMNAAQDLVNGLPGKSVSFRNDGLALFGFEPRAPGGGAFEMLPDRQLKNSMRGTFVQPTVSTVGSGANSLSNVLTRLHGISGALAFDGKDESQGLSANIKWSWRDR